MLTLLQENTDNLMISEKQHENKMKSWKKRKQKNQTEILELENKVIEQNNLIDNSSSRLNQAEDKIDEPEDGSIEIIQRSRKKIRKLKRGTLITTKTFKIKYQGRKEFYYIQVKGEYSNSTENSRRMETS